MRVDQRRTFDNESLLRVSASRLRSYLKQTGWLLERDLGKKLVAVYRNPKSPLKQIRVPIERQVSDYRELLEQAILRLAEWEQKPVEKLVELLLLPSADIIRFAENSSLAAAGDVPLEHGISLLNGARKLLLASACSVIKPEKFFVRMSFMQADQFIEQCRLGQTERGSFILTVACPLNAVPYEPDLFESAPFTRRVTSQLMRSLAYLADWIDVLGSEKLLSAASDNMMVSANLCEGLLDMAPEGNDSSLRICAELSPDSHFATDSDFPTSVELRHDAFPMIEVLARKLRPIDIPTKQVLVGVVETLNGRPNLEDRPEGQVTLRVMTKNSETLRAKAELNADHYAVADEAHMHNVPVSLEGVVRQIGRIFRIDDVSSFSLVRPDKDSGKPSD